LSLPGGTIQTSVSCPTRTQTDKRIENHLITKVKNLHTKRRRRRRRRA